MFATIIEIAKKKCVYHQEQWHTDRTTYEHYLIWMKEEIEEAENEIKLNNQIYLADELADVLRDYINVLVTLEEHGYIDSVEQVVDACHTKYEERITDKFNGIDRAITKQRQKQQLQQKHDDTYKQET